ncbi:MAG: tRNA lysidine(34) synthetase TilS [Acidimicrobiia bacterium]
MVGSDRLTELAATLAARLTVPAGPVAVALSGGADSAALLWLVARTGADVVAIHVFHGLAASSLMSTAAGQIAATCGVRMEMAVVHPPGAAEHHLREVRHAALVERAAGRPVLMAHTADDQAETVLMRALRGSGIDGLAGILPERGPIHHPMLSITRAEARELAELAGLPFRDDPSNEDQSILRNRIRSTVIPIIEDAIGHSPRDALNRLASLAQDESGLLDRAVDAIPIQHRDGAVRIPVGALLAAGPVLAARAVRRAMMQVAGPYPPDRRSLGRIMDVVSGAAGATEVEPQLRVTVVDGHLVVASEQPERDRSETAIVGGSTSWADWRFDAVEIDGPAVVPLSPMRLLAPSGLGPWAVRTVGTEDRVTGRRASDALADAGVPASERKAWPIVTCAGEPVWLPNVRARIWPGHLSGRYLCLVAVREPSWQIFEH